MDKRQSEYAELIVKIGVNVQKGQVAVVTCPIECASFGRLLAEKAYDAGASEVNMRWTDDASTRMKYLRADAAVFDSVPKWMVEFSNENAARQAAHIFVSASDPENLMGVSPDRPQRWAKASGAAMKDYQEKSMSNYFPWCVVSAPTDKWAQKVFPYAADAAEAREKLWEAIYKSVSVGGGNAVKLWKEKIRSMAERAAKLNNYNFKSLHYTNSLGTDLTVGLPEKHLWTACGEKAGNGVIFAANIPTEEIFTLPDKNKVNGTLFSSKPFILDGNIVEGIRLVFKDGKIVEADAKTGREHLLESFETDEGARYLGEVALVPYHSPISEMGMTFYNTLYDENASCHFAYGKAYPKFSDMDQRTPEELAARGMNDSVLHEDFMVGTPDLSIVGTTQSGEQIPVFVNGDFAF